LDLTAGRIVDVQTAIVAGREHILAVGTDRQRRDVRAGPLERADVLAIGRVPEADVLVTARRRDPLAVGAEGHRADIASVPAVGDQLLTVAHVPDLDGAIAAGRGEPAAIGAEGDREDLIAVPQSQVAEDASHMIGEVRTLVGKLPARLAIGLAGLEQPALL